LKANLKPILPLAILESPIYYELKYSNQVKPLEGSVRANVNETSQKYSLTAKVDCKETKGLAKIFEGCFFDNPDNFAYIKLS
jgi:hypothetical protein